MMDTPETAALRATRRMATGLLVAMAGVYLLTRWLEAAHPGWGYVRAFAEAAMVGGLADWFAVTALFRRPLGLPIPHTAVIPRSQGRIADAVGYFIAENFLSPDLVAERLARQDSAAMAARWLSDPKRAASLAETLGTAIPFVLDALDEEAVQDFLKRQARAGLPGERIGPAAGRYLRFLTEKGRHHALIDVAIEEGWRALQAHAPELRAKVRGRTGWFSRLLSVDAKAADAIVGGLEDMLRAVAADPAHPLRTQTAEALHRFARDLQLDPRMHARIESWAAEFFAHPAAQTFFADAWGQAKAQLRREAGDAGSALRQGLEGAIARLGRELLEDAHVRAALNARLSAFAVDLCQRRRGEVAAIVAETIRGWEAQTVVDKLEQQVGRDLQYIRVSGTLIGGSVGVALHALEHGLDLLG